MTNLFNLVLEYVLGEINKENLKTVRGQLAHTITKQRIILEKNIKELMTKGEKIGLAINESKTKVININKDIVDIDMK